MTKAEKIQKLLAIEEKRRRQRLKKPPYTPTPGQLKVLQSVAKNSWNFSGNGGGKTALNVVRAEYIAKGFNPWSGEKFKVPAKIAFVVDTSKKIDERIIPEFKKWFDVEEDELKKEGRPFTSKRYYPNGSEITFLTADSDPMSFEGVEFSAVIVDEPVVRPLYIALYRSLRMRGHANKFIFSGTAISQAWMRKEVFDPWKAGLLPDTECFQLKTSDNEANLQEGYEESFGSKLSEEEKKVRLEGGFFDLGSLALADYWKPDMHVIDDRNFVYDYRMPCIVAIDPHSVKPHTAVMIAVDRADRNIVIKETAFRGNATQFADELKRWEKGFNVVDRVCDSLGSMEMTSGEGMHSFIEGLNRNAVLVRPVTFKEKNHEDLIDRMRQGLTIPLVPDQFGKIVPNLRFLKSCGRVVMDIEQAAWQKNRSTGELIPKLDTSTKDFLSCLGYALALGVKHDTIFHGRPVYRSASPSVPEETRHKMENRRAEIRAHRMQRQRARFMSRITRS